ncbi:MAG: DUF11 domain-containing protein [Planctomycetaceae bacterium]
MRFTTSWFASLLRAQRQESRRQNAIRKPSPDHVSWYRLEQLEDRTLLSGVTDLEITKESPVVAVEQGAALTYTVIVSNIGAEGVTGVTVSDDYSDFLESVSWTAIVSGGASGNTSGTGVLSELVDLPAGSSIEYTIAGTVKDGVRDNITNVATVDMITYTDTDPTNNSAFDSDLIVLAAESGTGVFSAGQTFTGTDSDQGYSSTLGDIDGDGDLDVVFGNRNSASQLWKNNGDGTFTNTGQSLPSGTGIALGDLDGDGDLDLYAARGTSSLLDEVWLNDGSGTFTNSGQSLGPGNGRHVEFGDIDGDGDLDALTSYDGATNSIRVWLNNGSAAFTDSGQAINISGTGHWGLALGDLDGDGDLDLFASTYNTGDDAVFLNNGSGTFTLYQTVSITNGATLLVDLGDVDGDGDLDAAVTQGGGISKLLLNDGTGTFTLGQDLDDGINSTWSSGFGDFDNDGDLDLLLSKSNSEPDTLWLNDGSGNFTDSGQRLGSNDSSEVAIGDLDGDGDLDLISANYLDVNQVWLNEITLPYTQDFDYENALGLVLNTPGTFSFVDDGGNSLLQSDNSGFTGLSTAVLEFDSLPSAVDIAADITAVSGPNKDYNGFLIFDYISDTDFKYAGLLATTNEWIIGHYQGDFNNRLATVDWDEQEQPLTIDLDQAYHLELYLNEEYVELTVNGELIVFAQFAAPVTGGRVGVASKDAMTRFDDFSVAEGAIRTTDLSITKTSSVVAVEQGASLIYTVVVSNDGNENVGGVMVTDEYSSFLDNATWTAVVAGGAIATLTGTGDLSEQVVLPTGASVTYTISGTVKDNVRDNITNVATIGGGSYTESDPTNNSAFDSDLIVLAAEGGTGFFSAGQTFTGTDTTYSSTLGDIDGDGDLDVVSRPRYGGQVWKNNGDGTFTNTGQSLPAGISAELGDLMGMGTWIFTCQGFYPSTPDEVWLNDGSGTFTTSGQALGTDNSRFVKLGDIDGDGDRTL